MGNIDFWNQKYGTIWFQNIGTPNLVNILEGSQARTYYFLLIQSWSYYDMALSSLLAVCTHNGFRALTTVFLVDRSFWFFNTRIDFGYGSLVRFLVFLFLVHEEFIKHYHFTVFHIKVVNCKIWASYFIQF